MIESDEKFLETFMMHLKKIRSFLTKEEIIRRMKDKSCLFLGFEGMFKGDKLFEEAQCYLHDHPNKRTLSKAMYKTIDQLWR